MRLCHCVFGYETMPLCIWVRDYVIVYLGMRLQLCMRLYHCCFGVVFYINMCITHVKIPFISLRRTIFLASVFFLGLPPNRSCTPVGTACTGVFYLKFVFHWFLPVSGRTGPLNQYRTRPVRLHQSV
jgi:hypothetical protein